MEPAFPAHFITAAEKAEHLRNLISDVRSKFYELKKFHVDGHHTLDAVEGLLTCGIVTLCSYQDDVNKYDIKWHGGGVEKVGKPIVFSSRGIGLDSCPGCFVCNKPKRTDDPTKSDLLNNISAFVSSKADGEEIIRWFRGTGARLDWREWEPNWIQVKIGACDKHLPQLKWLSRETRKYNRLWRHQIEDARKFVPAEGEMISE